MGVLYAAALARQPPSDEISALIMTGVDTGCLVFGTLGNFPLGRQYHVTTLKFCWTTVLVQSAFKPHGFLLRQSRSEVPKALTYLILS